jgi:hypothetical protein
MVCKTELRVLTRTKFPTLAIRIQTGIYALKEMPSRSDEAVKFHRTLKRIRQFHRWLLSNVRPFV